MALEIREERVTILPLYARIPIAFTVNRVVDATSQPSGEFALTERSVEAPYEKDYDAIEGEGPLHWSRCFDLSRWGILTARLAERIVGGAVIAFDTPGVTMLEGRGDLAVLWDIRVAPDVRGRGTGFALFRKVEAWARARGCRQLKVETQDINAGACRFYERQGCYLRAVNREAYPHLPSETQLLWYKDLST